jgi:hypothetical protein
MPRKNNAENAENA